MPSIWSGLASLQDHLFRQFMFRITKAVRVLVGGTLCTLACALFTFSHAQDPISYNIQGVEDDKLRNNIRLHLNSLDVEKSLLTDPFWQDEVGETVATAVQPMVITTAKPR